MTTRTRGSCPTCAGLVLDVEDWNQVNHPACKRDTRSALADEFVAAVERGDVAAADRIEATLASHDRDDRLRSLRKRALWYAHRGWPVFPLRPGDKRPLTHHGFRDASTDPQVVHAWWTATPEANIGIATGFAFDVFDIDWLDKHGRPTQAVELWPVLRDSGELPDIHGVALTARSGLHLFLEPSGTGNLAGHHRGSAFSGLDYRGRGGYIVAPPSRYPDGRGWSWVVPPSPRITNQADYPNGEPVPAPEPGSAQAELFAVAAPPPALRRPPRTIARAADPLFERPRGSGIRDRWLVGGMDIDRRWEPVRDWQTWGTGTRRGRAS